MRRNIRTFNLIKAIGALSGLVMGVSVLTACDSVNNAAGTVSDGASQIQDGASKASDIVNSLPTSPSQVRDKLTAKLQTETLVLDADSCSQTNGVELHVKSLSSNWPTGPYITYAEQSATKDGDYTPVPDTAYDALNPSTSANPSRTWHWNCGIPKDHLGYLRFSIVHLDNNGQLDKATKWAYARVVA